MTRIFLARIAVIAFLLAGGGASAQPAPDVASAQGGQVSQNSIKLVEVIASLPVGAPWLKLGRSLTFCNAPMIQTWVGGRVSQDLSFYSEAFKTEMDRVGYKTVTPGVDNLYDAQAGSADYVIAAVITDEHIDGCISNGGQLTSTARGDIRGKSAMKVDRQIYSPLRKQVVARISTSASAELQTAVPGVRQGSFQNPFPPICACWRLIRISA